MRKKIFFIALIFFLFLGSVAPVRDPDALPNPYDKMNNPTPVKLVLGLGLVAILFQFWKDYKTGFVDSRKNYFMSGVTIAAYILTNNVLVYFSFVLLVFGIGGLFGNRMGDGDKEILFWAVPLLNLINVKTTIVFLFWIFVFITIQALLLSEYKKDKAPGGPIYAGAYVLSILPALVF